MAPALLLAVLAAGCAARSGGAVEPLSDDDRITAEVVRILENDEDIVAADLSVATSGGVVVVSGVQETIEPLRDVLQRIARVRGVTEVVNRIRILRDVGAVPPGG